MIWNPLARPLNVRRAIAAAIVTALVAAATAAAQEPVPTPTAHTVKRGDTLWDIAKMYLNDPFLWPEIYRLNTNIVEDPHWIYPGEVLALPGAGGGGAQVVSEDQVERPAPAVGEVRAPVGGTVFAIANRRRAVSSSKFGGTANTYPHTAIRAGQFYAAPWLDRLDGPAGAGRIVESAQVRVGVTEQDRLIFLDNEYVYITLPKGMVASKGDRLLAYTPGPDVGADSRVMVPTGILEVTKVDGAEAVLVQIVQMFNQVKRDNFVIPLEKFTMDPNARPAPLLLGTEGKVILIPTVISVATKLNYVLLDVSLKDGVKLGDQFTLYRPRKKVELTDAPAVTVPEEPIGLVQVVKVTQRGTTAVVVDVRHPAIQEGVSARLTARMP